MKVKACTWDPHATIYKGGELTVRLAISKNGTQISTRIMVGISTRIRMGISVWIMVRIVSCTHDTRWLGDSLSRPLSKSSADGSRSSKVELSLA